MLKQFAQFLSEMKETKIFDVDGKKFTNDPNLEEIIPHVDRPTVMTVTSLDAICKLVRTEIERNVYPLFVCAEEYNKVVVYSTYRDDYTRDTIYMAKADAPGLSLGWRSQQEMIIALQSLVIPTEASAELLNMLKSMTDESSITSRDNGVTQEVTVKSGVSLAKTVQVKPRVKLIPFRTFLEVSQPESEYLVRVDKGNQIGLFEADGGIWKLEAKKNIAMYFERELCGLIEVDKVVVIR